MRRQVRYAGNPLSLIRVTHLTWFSGVILSFDNFVLFHLLHRLVLIYCLVMHLPA